MQIKGIPKSEILWLTQKTNSGNTYYITSKQQRDRYYLYQLIDGSAVKLCSDKNPARLLDQYMQ